MAEHLPMQHVQLHFHDPDAGSSVQEELEQTKDLLACCFLAWIDLDEGSFGQREQMIQRLLLQGSIEMVVSCFLKQEAY